MTTPPHTHTLIPPHRKEIFNLTSATVMNQQRENPVAPVMTTHSGRGNIPQLCHTSVSAPPPFTWNREAPCSSLTLFSP